MSKIERDVERFCAIQLARARTPDYVHRFRTALGALRRFLEQRGKNDLREVTREDLRAYLRWLDRRRAATTVQLELIRLRLILRFLHEAGLLLRNPAANLRRKHVTSPLRDWLTEQEVPQLLERPRTTTDLGLRDRAALELLYSSGLRIGELRRLDLDDLDLAQGFVTVRESKTGRGRVVPVGRVAVQWLTRYLRSVRPRLVAKNGRGRQRPLSVFVGLTGRALARDAIGSAVRRYAQEAKLGKRVSPHVLRHSFAAHLLKNGASTRHIQEMLGHRNLATTQIYAHLLPLDLRRVHQRCHPSEKRLPPVVE